MDCDGDAGESEVRIIWDEFEWELGVLGEKGERLAGGVGFAGGWEEGAGGSRAMERQQKVTPRRIALFFSTLSAMTTRCRLHDRRRQV